MSPSRIPRVDYDKIAHLYDAQRMRGKQVDPHLLQFLQEHPARAKTLAILDIGCGTGNQLLANQARLPNARFVGLDLFHGMLRQAIAKPGARPNTSWIQADGALLPLANDTFDFVSNQFSFHHVQDKPEMIRSVLRSLRPGGRFVVSNICPREMPGWLIYRTFPAAWKADLHDFMPYDDVASHMERAGFVNIQVDLNHIRSKQRLGAFVEMVRRRNTCSQLITIADADYEAGLRLLETKLSRGADTAIDDEVCLLTIYADKKGSLRS